MGKINTQFFDDLAKKASWSAGVAFQRSNALPLDKYSVFETLTKAEEYLSSSTSVAYPGQVIAVLEDSKMVVYVIKEVPTVTETGEPVLDGNSEATYHLELDRVGIVPQGDGKSIQVSAEGVINILGADSADSLTLPRMKEDKSGIEWVPVSAVVEGDGNDNTTYEISALKNADDETYGISVKTLFNGTEVEGGSFEISFDVYTKKEIDAKIDAIEVPVEGIADEEKVLSLTDKKLSTTLSIAKTKKDNGKTYVQLIGKDNTIVSEFDAAEFVADGMLDSVTKDVSTNEIIFTWNTSAGKTETRIDIDELVEVYTAGNGIDIADFVVSAKISNDSEAFLTVDATGIKLSGVQTAIDAGKDAAIADAEGKVDALAEQVEETYATKAFVGAIPEGYAETDVVAYVNKKVSESDKKLSDYQETHAEEFNTVKNKVDGIEAGAQVNVIESVTVADTEKSKITVTTSGKAVTIDDAGLQSEIGSVRTVAERADTTAAANASEITKINTAIEKNETDIQSVTETANANKATIEAHAVEFTTLSGKVDAEAGKVTQLQTDVANKAEQSALNTTNETVAKHTSDIAGLQETVGTHTTQIEGKADKNDTYTKAEVDAAIAAGDNANAGNITQLTTRVSDLENTRIKTIGSKNNGIEIVNTDTLNPTIGVKLSGNENNALSIVSDGLLVTIPEVVHPEYTVKKLDTVTEGAASSYQLFKDDVAVGAKIDIPKDMVVQSGTVETKAEAGDWGAAGTYIVLTLANAANDKLYIPADSLIEYVTSGSSETDLVKIHISDDHKITASLGMIDESNLSPALLATLATKDELSTTISGLDSEETLSYYNGLEYAKRVYQIDGVVTTEHGLLPQVLEPIYGVVPTGFKRTVENLDSNVVAPTVTMEWDPDCVFIFNGGSATSAW